MKRNFLLITIMVLLALLFTACGGEQAAVEDAAQVEEPAAEEVVEEPTAEEAAEEPAAEEAVEAPTAEEAVEEPAEEAESEPVTLRALIRPDEGANVATYVDKFREETGIDVQVDFVGWAEIHDKTITTLASGGGGYDIVFIPSANVVEFASGGWFEPINDMITDENRDEWLEAVVDLYTYEGDLIAMPWYAGGAHMAYNVEMLETAGVDPNTIETWDDFMAACEQIVEAEAAPFCFAPSAKYPGNFYYNWGTQVASIGGQFFDEDGNPIFQDGEEALAALQMIDEGVESELFDPAGIALDDYETLIAFGSGQTAFLLDSTWSVTQANRNQELSGVTGNANIMLIPGDEEQRSGGYLYAGGLGLLNTSEHKEEAKQFLEFLTSAEAQKHHAIEGANLPTRTALYDDPEIAAAWPGFEILAEQLTYGMFPPQFSWFEEWRRSSATAVQDVMGDRSTPEEAIEFLVTETERLQAESQ